MSSSQDILTQEAIELLKKLISIQSFSKEEDRTAAAIQDWFTAHGILFERKNNNVFAKNKDWNDTKLPPASLLPRP